MENVATNQEQKYQKLASEYSKIRAQASVLKRAVIEEQSKNSSLRENLRLKETSLRRAEQEVDSLGFRNKQLEHRVESLQDDLNKDTIKKNKLFNKNNTNKTNVNHNENNITSIGNTDPVLTEEFQKKIFENAKLTSLIADKEAEIILYKNRVTDLEKQLSHRVSDNSEIEKKLRKEIEVLSTKNSELETKVAEAASMLGSEDGLSVTGSDNTPIHNTTTTSTSSTEERIINLEKEINYWRTQYEILKLNDNHSTTTTTILGNSKAKNLKPNHNNHSNVDVDNDDDDDENNIDLDIPNLELTKEQMLVISFNKKYEKIFLQKFLAETKIKNYLIECEMLQNNLEILTNEMAKCELELKDVRRKLEISEEDLTTTRINYEEQICVLTEQVISLSDQLASLK